MNWLEVLGYAGGLLVFSTFYLKTMIRLRIVAIASNVVYVAYALMGHMVPILVLHIFLLPLNIWRLVEVKRLIRKVHASAQSGIDGDQVVDAFRLQTMPGIEKHRLVARRDRLRELLEQRRELRAVDIEARQKVEIQVTQGRDDVGCVVERIGQPRHVRVGAVADDQGDTFEGRRRRREA